MTDRNWQAINPKRIAAECSPVHIENVIADLRADVLRLQAFEQFARDVVETAKSGRTPDSPLADIAWLACQAESLLARKAAS